MSVGVQQRRATFPALKGAVLLYDTPRYYCSAVLQYNSNALLFLSSCSSREGGVLCVFLRHGKSCCPPFEVA